MSRVTKARSHLALTVKASKKATNLSAPDETSTTAPTGEVPQPSGACETAQTEAEPEAVQDARRHLAEEVLRQHIERTVASAPALRAEQRERLAALLRGAGASA